MIASGGAAAAAPAAPAAAPAAPRPRSRAAAAAAAPAAAKGPRDPRDEVQPLSRMRLALAGERRRRRRRSRPRCGPRSRSTTTTSTGPAQAQGAVQEGDRRVAVVPAVRLPGGGRRAAGVPDGQLLDRRRGQDHDAAPVRQPRRSRSTSISRASWCRWSRTPTSSTCAGSPRGSPRWPPRPGRRSCRRRRHAGVDLHDHQPRPVRQLRLGADHQSAERRHPVHRRASSGGRWRSATRSRSTRRASSAWSTTTAPSTARPRRCSSCTSVTRLEKRDWEAEVG